MFVVTVVVIVVISMNEYYYNVLQPVQKNSDST